VAQTRLVLALPLLLIGGCTALEPPSPEPWTARAPLVAESRYTHTVHFETDRAELAPSERASLDAFLAALPAEGRYRAVVSGHADERASDAYNLALSERRARHVADLLRAHGLERVEVSPRAHGEGRPVDPGRGEPAWARNRRVEILVRHWVAEAPRCGEGDRTPSLHGQQLLPDLGCATAANLVAMVADPADLAEGRPLGPADGVREAEAIVRYRTDKVRPLAEQGKGP
jgi:pilus biogenesis lipoprotein CpaD